jgi:GT2 family glycosyltransferase
LLQDTLMTPDSDRYLPSLGAVVLGWNYHDDSAECLRSILADGYPRLRVWFVDNGSTDGTPAALRQEFPGITIMELGENRGLVAGYNAGIEAALSAGDDYVCVFNNDVAVAPGSFRALIGVARADPSAGLFVPKIVLYSDPGVIWSAGAYRRRLPPGIVQRGLGQPASDPRFARVTRVTYATSCVWMMSAAMIRQVGLFDSHYRFYYSDYEYCRRVTDRGWHILYAPDAVVRHKVSLSTQQAPRPGRWWTNMGEAEALFYRRYENQPLLMLHAAWITLRTIVQGQARYIPAYLQGLRAGLRT